MRTDASDSRHRRDASLAENPVSATLAANAEELATVASAEEGVGDVFDAEDATRHRHRRSRGWHLMFKRRPR